MHRKPVVHPQTAIKDGGVMLAVEFHELLHDIEPCFLTYGGPTIYTFDCIPFRKRQLVERGQDGLLVVVSIENRVYFLSL